MIVESNLQLHNDHPGVTQLKGWIPAHIALQTSPPGVLWLDFRDVFFNDPFFNDTLERLQQTHPDTPEHLTGLDALVELRKIADSLKPTGFIFHMSRCGSTLVSNALQVLKDTIVISEAQPIEALLWVKWPETMAQWVSQRNLLIESTVAALGQRRRGTERNLFIKFVSWNTLQLEVVRAIWPDVPWLFVYRDPVEVMISQLLGSAGWMRLKANQKHSAAILGWDAEEIVSMTREAYCAKLVGRMCSTVAGAIDDHTMLMNYSQISPEAILKVMQFFGMTPSTDETAAVTQTLRIYSKDPSGEQVFVSDTGWKRRSAYALIHTMAQRWAVEPYEVLNRIQREKGLAPHDFRYR